jgi:hypothetical protein
MKNGRPSLSLHYIDLQLFSRASAPCRRGLLSFMQNKEAKKGSGKKNSPSECIGRADVFAAGCIY